MNFKLHVLRGYSKTHRSLPILILLAFLISGCGTFETSELKGYYKPLVVSQYSLNRDDIENQKQYVDAIISGKEAALKYYIQINSKVYYVLRDVLYTKKG